MKTGSQNHSMAVILLCVSLVFVTMLACNIPGRGWSAKEESAAVPAQTTNGKQGGQEPAIACYPGIVPGRSTLADVLALLGQPVYNDQEGATKRLFYTSPISGQNNIIELENDLVSYISIVFADAQIPRLSEIQAELGQPEHTTYSAYMRGTRTYLYPGQGLLLVADPSMDFVFIQECFQPQALGDFLGRYGTGLPEQDPYIRGPVIGGEAPPPADDSVGDALTERKIFEPVLIYPGTRVIYDKDDRLLGVTGKLILAVDAPLSEVIAFYRQGYQDGFLALEPDEAEGIREFVLIKDMFDWGIDDIEAFYQELIDSGQADYSLTMIGVIPADEFNRPDFYIAPDETIGAYSPAETLIVFMMTHLENFLNMDKGQ